MNSLAITLRYKGNTSLHTSAMAKLLDVRVDYMQLLEEISTYASRPLEHRENVVIPSSCRTHTGHVYQLLVYTVLRLGRPIKIRAYNLHAYQFGTYLNQSLPFRVISSSR